MGECRFAAAVVVLVVFGAFGPYISGGMRTEQAVIYGLLLLVLPFNLLSMRVPVWGVRVGGVWLIYLLGALVGVALPVIGVPAGGELAGLDNLLLPLALMVLVWAAARPWNAALLLRLAAKLIAACMALNGLVAMLQTSMNLTGILRPFAGSSELVQTTAANAAVLGRYTGVFNQPAEAGLAYAVAGLAACYAWRRRPAILYLVLVPVILGGLISTSKVFVLGGLALILWQVITGPRAGRWWLVLVGGATAIAIIQSGALDHWVGHRFLERLLGSGNSDWLSLYTAGRIGSDSTLSSVVEQVTNLNPLTGAGLGGLHVAYDNGWVEAFVMAGVVGVACYTVTLVLMFVAARTDQDLDRRRFMTAVALLSIGASIGIPALTANRAGTLIWLLVALAFLARSTGSGGRNRLSSGTHDDADMTPSSRPTPGQG